jgi:thiosulfate/3-mercaptopyruvate sulfurtransferase
MTKYHLVLGNILIILTLMIITMSCEDKIIPKETISIVPIVDSNNIDLSQYAAATHLVNPDQLDRWQKNKSLDIVLIDARKKEYYEKGHLKGAHQVWRPEIRSKSYPYKGIILEKDAFEKVMGRLGANSKSRIVVYDGTGNTDAARLWWMLALYGHENAYILNGGILNVEKGKITQDSTIASPKNFAFTGTERQELLASKTDVISALKDSNTVLLDCRTLDEHTGITIKKGAFRAGHIPEVLHIEHSESIAYERSCTFRNRKDLEERFKTVPKDKNIIIYCQSGVRSAHTTFVLRELLGYINVSNYDGSWIEWSYNKNLPIITEVENPAVL